MRQMHDQQWNHEKGTFDPPDRGEVNYLYIEDPFRTMLYKEVLASDAVAGGSPHLKVRCDIPAEDGLVPVHLPGYRLEPPGYRLDHRGSTIDRGVPQQLPDIHFDNPGGSTGIFYSGIRHSTCKFAGMAHASTSWIPPPHITLLPAVDRLEELLQWAEAQAAMSGIVPPYRKANFRAESVMPRSTSGAGSSTDAGVTEREGWATWGRGSSSADAAEDGASADCAQDGGAGSSSSAHAAHEGAASSSADAPRCGVCREDSVDDVPDEPLDDDMFDD